MENKRQILNQQEQLIAREQKLARQKRARNPEEVYAEIGHYLDSQAQKLGLTPTEYRERLKSETTRIQEPSPTEEIGQSLIIYDSRNKSDTVPVESTGAFYVLKRMGAGKDKKLPRGRLD